MIRGYLRHKQTADADDDQEPESLVFNGDPEHDAVIRKKWVSARRSTRYRGLTSSRQTCSAAGEAAQEPRASIAAKERENGHHRRCVLARRQESQARNNTSLRQLRTNWTHENEPKVSEVECESECRAWRERRRKRCQSFRGWSAWAGTGVRRRSLRPPCATVGPSALHRGAHDGLSTIATAYRSLLRGQCAFYPNQAAVELRSLERGKACKWCDSDNVDAAY